MSAEYDVVTVGGGVAGACLAKLMAERGARVLVLERDTIFKDRVRGEALLPWGAAELDRLGLRQAVLETCGTEVRWWDSFLGHQQLEHRDTILRTPGGKATLTFYHPAMQETMLSEAEKAGAEVRRGARAAEVTPGEPATVSIAEDDRQSIVVARLVVGADGRASHVRQWGGFAPRKSPSRYQIAGILLDTGNAVSPNATHAVMNPQLGQAAILIPQRDARARAYVTFPTEARRKLSGERDVERFFEEVLRTGIGAETLRHARAIGPLATFDCADTWVEHPYTKGVALIGDAAATSDPTWGQGLSLAVRDVRVLRDALLQSDDWDAAGHAYAADHSRAFRTIREVTALLTALFIESGPEADTRRKRAFSVLAAEPDRIPDSLMSGPDLAPADNQISRHLFSP